MFWVSLALLVVAAGAAKLDGSAYLPPNARDAGGQDDDLQPPLDPPYIDQYSYRDSRYLVAPKRSYNSDDDGDLFSDGKNRFLYGSYSYTGPDNVLVTVTYTAPKKDRGYDEYYRRAGGYGYDADLPQYALEGGVVPTPPSLPRELQKAFAFHRKNYNNRKDAKSGYDYKEPTGRQHWSNTPNAAGVSQQGKPVIHQGYSYPKPTA